MDVYIDRSVTKDEKTLGKFTDQPGLVDMTRAALNTLDKNEKGFS